MRYSFYRGTTWAGWALAAPWLAWKRSGGGAEWRERLGEVPRGSGGLWVHAASVGEVAAASPLVGALAELGEDVLLTALTPAGRDAARGLERPGVTSSFPPLDVPPPVSRALDRSAPRALVIVETELWPNMIVEARRAGASVCIVNGRLSERSVRRYLSPLFPLGDVRAAVSFVACRSEDDRERFARLGFEEASLEVTGSTKFDVLSEASGAEESDALRRSLGLAGESPVVVFGSVRPAEEGHVLRALERALAAGDVHAVVAPRHLRRAEALAERLRSRGIAFSRRSEGGPANGGRVTLLDTTGELAAVYALSDVAFVGGTLAPYGGHNPLEPAAAGVPVLLGPHTSSCSYEAELLVERGGALRVEADQLGAAVLELLGDEEMRRNMGRRAAEAVSSGRGATRRTVEIMRKRGVIAREGRGAA